MAGTSFTGPLKDSPQTDQKGYSYRSGMGMVPSAEYYVFFDDFDTLVTGNVPTGWTADIIDTGATVASASGHTGVIQFTDATASEGAAIYMPKNIQVDGKKTYVECRVTLSDVVDHTFYFGLSDLAATTNPEDLYDASASDVIACGIADGSARVKLLYNKDGSTDTDDVSTGADGLLVAATAYTIAFLVDGTGTDSSMLIKTFVNGKLVVTSTTETNVPEDVVLALFISSVNGNGAGANTADVDYIKVVTER